MTGDLGGNVLLLKKFGSDKGEEFTIVTIPYTKWVHSLITSRLVGIRMSKSNKTSV